MGQIVLIWGFPFYLIVLEMLFRSVSGLDVSNFVGPAIATAGLSFLLPLTKPKEDLGPISKKQHKVIKESGYVIVNLNDQRLVPFVWIAILCGFIIWFWASSISASKPKEQFFFLPLHVAVGLVNYCTAAIFTIVKEKV